MSAKILDFTSAKGKPHHRASDAKAKIDVKSPREIFQDTYEDVIGDWQRFAVRNRLNEYVASKLPSLALSVAGADYVNDLNVISTTEQKLKMTVAVFGPAATANNPIGWMAAFNHGREIYSTASDMSSEANARAINIVLFVLFNMHLKTLGLD